MQTLAPPSAARGTVLVFQPQWLDDADDPRRFPYRLLPLLGALRADGWRVVLAEEAFDGPPRPSWRRTAAGATAAVAWCGEMYPGTQIPGVLRFLDALGGGDGPPLLVGGGFFPLVAERGLRLQAAAGAVLEPGEVALPLALEALRAGRPVADVPGVATWSGGAFRRNPPPPRRPLAGAWYGVLRALDLDRYARHAERLVFDDDGPAFQLATGLGCAKRCAFCFDERTPLRVFPAEAVVGAVAWLARARGLRRIQLGELDLLHSRRRALAIVRGLARLRREVPDLRWFALASVADLLGWSARELDLLPRAGCWRLELGSEAGSAAHLRRLGKRHAPGDAVEAARRLAARGVRSTHNLLLGAPGETEADRRATLRLAVRLAAVSPLVRVQPRRYQLAPATTTGEAALEEMDDRPRTLEEIAAYRDGLGEPGALPWLEARDERWVTDLVEYVLPMAYEAPPRAASARRRALRALARLRCRLGLRAGSELERALWERGLAGRREAGLPGTFVR